MRFRKLLGIFMAFLMLITILASCNGNGGDNNPDATTTEAPESTVTVSLTVLDVNDNVVYEVKDYTYTGNPNPLEILDYYMDVELGLKVEYDEYDDIESIGEAKRENVMGTDASGAEVVLKNTYWWYKVNGTRQDKSMSEYQVKTGDSIVFYLEKTDPK